MKLPANVADRVTWAPILFALLVSEAVPRMWVWSLEFRPMIESSLQPGIREFGELSPAALLFLVFVFPVREAFVILAALSVYLAITKSFTRRGFVCGSIAGFGGLCLAYVTIMYLSSIFWDLYLPGTNPVRRQDLEQLALHSPHPIVIYVVLRLPLFFALALGLWVAHRTVRLERAGTGLRNLTSKQVRV